MPRGDRVAVFFVFSPPPSVGLELSPSCSVRADMYVCTYLCIAFWHRTGRTARCSPASCTYLLLRTPHDVCMHCISPAAKCSCRHRGGGRWPASQVRPSARMPARALSVYRASYIPPTGVAGIHTSYIHTYIRSAAEGRERERGKAGAREDGKNGRSISVPAIASHR